LFVVKVTIESPDLDFVYSDSDHYDAEISGLNLVTVSLCSADTVNEPFCH